ncbi:MAG: D-alanine--D-alanine ligase family protein [Ignavibacteria bacterium]
MRVTLTYNIKKEEHLTELSSFKNRDGLKYFIDNNFITNYAERINDTYAEWDSFETIDAIRVALENRSYQVTLVEADINVCENLKASDPDIVFNIAEGFWGPSRESQVPAILEMLNIPFTGSDSITIGICHDKARCKEILSYNKIPNADFFIAESPVNKKKLKFPKFVKPLHEGSSKGIYNSSVVYDLNQLNSEIERIKTTYNQPSLVEDFLEGKEFTVAMLGNYESVKILPIVEVKLDSVPEGFPNIYSYEVKWFFDTRENQLDIFNCPAKLDSSLQERIEKVCMATFKALRLRDWARIDLRLDKDNIPNVLEVNPLPGILPDPRDNSCYPKAARAAGMDYETMINSVLNEAISRYKLNEKFSLSK